MTNEAAPEIRIKACNVAEFIDEHCGFNAKATKAGMVRITTTTDYADAADGWFIAGEFAEIEIEPTYNRARWLLGY